MKKFAGICPVCDVGDLSFSNFSDQFEYHGELLSVGDLECCNCEICGAQPILPDQIRRNHLKIADAKREHDGLFKGHQIRELRLAAGLTQKVASSLFGGGANAFSKYERGVVAQSSAMDKLLWIAVFSCDAVDLLKLRSGMPSDCSMSFNYTDVFLRQEPVVKRSVGRLSDLNFHRGSSCDYGLDIACYG